jgi:hypothetical protein
LNVGNWVKAPQIDQFEGQPPGWSFCKQRSKKYGGRSEIPAYIA